MSRNASQNQHKMIPTIVVRTNIKELWDIPDMILLIKLIRRLSHGPYRSAYIPLTFCSPSPYVFQFLAEAVIWNHVFQKHDQPCNNGFIEIIIWKHAFEKQTHATSQAMNNQCSRSLTNTNTVRSMLTKSVVWKHVFQKHGQPCNNGIIQIKIWKHAFEKTIMQRHTQWNNTL